MKISVVEPIYLADWIQRLEQNSYDDRLKIKQFQGVYLLRDDFFNFFTLLRVNLSKEI